MQVRPRLQTNTANLRDIPWITSIAEVPQRPHLLSRVDGLLPK